jgi:hypothetical protein
VRPNHKNLDILLADIMNRKAEFVVLLGGPGALGDDASHLRPPALATVLVRPAGHTRGYGVPFRGWIRVRVLCRHRVEEEGGEETGTGRLSTLDPESAPGARTHRDGLLQLQVLSLRPRSSLARACGRRGRHFRNTDGVFGGSGRKRSVTLVTRHGSLMSRWLQWRLPNGATYVLGRGSARKARIMFE